MYITIKANLLVSDYIVRVLEEYKKCYHMELERLIQCYQKAGQVYFIGYREMSNKISFHSKEHLLRLSQKFYEIRKTHSKAIFHRMFVLSNRSFQITKSRISMQFGHAFQRSTITCNSTLNEYQCRKIEQSEILRLDVKKESKHYVVRIILKQADMLFDETKQKVMGIDLGMKCPAVCFTEDNKVKFIGNGREIKYHERILKQRYQKLQKTGNAKKLEKHAHLLHNYKNHIDHCISKEIVDFALEESVSVIRLEKLTHLQQKFHCHDQVCWSYQRVSHFIEYKANQVGIRVEYVDPYLTTKRCPSCGKINNVKGRDYRCRCGFRKHRDLVGAMNILYAPKA